MNKRMDKLKGQFYFMGIMVVLFGMFLVTKAGCKVEKRVEQIEDFTKLGKVRRRRRAKTA